MPFYARGVAYHDEVQTCTSEEGFFPTFESVTKRSGYSTVRLFIQKDEGRSALVTFFTSRECLVEFNGRLVAIAIPKASFDQVSEHITEEMDGGRWGAEDGYLVIDE